MEHLLNLTCDMFWFKARRYRVAEILAIMIMMKVRTMKNCSSVTYNLPRNTTLLGSISTININEGFAYHISGSRLRLFCFHADGYDLEESIRHEETLQQQMRPLAFPDDTLTRAEVHFRHRYQIIAHFTVCNSTTAFNDVLHGAVSFDRGFQVFCDVYFYLV